jgi:Histidine kinase-, DNA gyrase B-, and HSP90-like ATPase
MRGKTRNAPPRAGAMLEALRGLGYSTAAALADIIDNSVSAEATEVRVNFVWAGTASRVSVLDDGRGMDDAEVESAMRLGDKNPLDARAPEDLGRFGMGLKTASFSQCRRLTLASVKAGARACLRWDLDALAADPDGGWLLFEGPATGSEPFLTPLVQLPAGTLVLWETLDRIVTAGYKPDDFNDLIDRVEAHLAMVFHRLLQGPKPRLRLMLNGRAVAPWDPFMMGHPAKPWASSIARTNTDAGPIEVECHVLPHKDKLSASEFDVAGGPEGWTAQQGFYVYRNERLLVAGGWLGLGQSRAWNREEAQRLARIRLDIPNTADAAWKIDIRKSTARPPVSLRPWLTRLAEDTRERARKVFAFRGTPGPGPGGVPVEQAWHIERTKAGARYRIDEKHPAVAAVLDGSGERLPLVRAMLRVIEETVPVQRIWLDTAENKETPRTGFAGEPPEAVVGVLKTLFADMVGRRGMSAEAAKRTLMVTEPFQNFSALIAALSTNDPQPG